MVTHRRHVLSIVLLTLMVFGTSATPVGAAPGTSQCGGSRYATVLRSDYTTFDSRKDCASYLEAGGTLRPAPWIEMVFLEDFWEHCEALALLRDFPVGTSVTMVVSIPPNEWVSVQEVDATGGGFGFSLPFADTAGITATYTLAGISRTTSVSYDCPRPYNK